MKDVKITIISSQDSWLNDSILDFIQQLEKYQVSWVHHTQEIKGGDIAFFLGFNKILTKKTLEKHKNNIVVHESDLPKGKGMSPVSWQVLKGKDEIQITLFEMVEKLDSGDVYLQDTMRFNGLELVSEIRSKQAKYTFKLCLNFLDRYPEILNEGHKQSGKETFYKKRLPEDSNLDVNKTLLDQFNLLRIVDNDRYPAFFEHRGEKFFIRISKK
jgi:methionyl-tRNA formyltransferase